MIPSDMNKTDMDVGLIIPVYNRPTLVIDTLDSVAAQTVLPGQVIVVDDGSTDSTAKEVEKWIDNLKIPLNIRLVSTENRGVSSARNHGLDILKDYEFVSLLDSDDIWPESFIERMTPLLKENSTAVGVSCDKIVKSEGSLDSFIPFNQIKNDPISFMFKNGAGLLSNSMFRCKYIFETGLFDTSTKTGEDAALCLPLSLLGPWLHLSSVQVIFRMHNFSGEESNKHCKDQGSMLRAGKIYESFINQVNTDNPKLLKWKVKLSSIWLHFCFARLKKFAFADSLYCFYRAVFWVFSSLKH